MAQVNPLSSSLPGRVIQRLKGPAAGAPLDPVYGRVGGQEGKAMTIRVVRGAPGDKHVHLVSSDGYGHRLHQLSLDEGMQLSDDLDDELAEHGLRPDLSLEEVAEVVKQSKEAPEPTDAPEVIPAGTAPGDRLQVGMVLDGTSVGRSLSQILVESIKGGMVRYRSPWSLLMGNVFFGEMLVEAAKNLPLAQPFVVPTPTPKPPRVYVPAGWIPGEHLRVGMVVKAHDGKHRVTDVGDDFACLDGIMRVRSLVSRLPIAEPYFGPE